MGGEFSGERQDRLNGFSGFSEGAQRKSDNPRRGRESEGKSDCSLTFLLSIFQTRARKFPRLRFT